MAINSLCQLRRHPGKRQSKRHLDGETISRSIEVEKCEPVDSLARPQGREDYTQADDPEGQTVEWSKFDRGLLLAIVPHWGHPGPPENTSLTERSIVLQPSPVWNLLIAARIKKANRYPDWPLFQFRKCCYVIALWEPEGANVLAFFSAPAHYVAGLQPCSHTPRRKRV